MISIYILPTLNALLNALSAILLTAGYIFIRQKRVREHRRCMLLAFGTSTLFLISYLVYHFQVGATAFQGPGLIRPIYYGLLISHIVLAILLVPLALTVLYRALQGRFLKHKPLARQVLPIWLYVSITGVVVYLVLYHLYPSSAVALR